jgi:hypothetical protein
LRLSYGLDIMFQIRLGSVTEDRCTGVWEVINGLLEQGAGQCDDTN